MENKYRNSFHIEPNSGLLNDPNGLIQFQGKYYFFHQWNRFNLNHSYKEWGLFTSDNLIDWKNQGSAIVPDSFDDKDGIYSGSAVEDGNKLYLFYTGNSKNNGNRQSYQKVAVSKDGKTFVKQNKNIATPEGFSENHRDPKVWKQNSQWWMIVGAQTLENKGAITLFQSKDLLNWDFQGTFFTNDTLDQMCECPDYFVLEDQVEILTVCPQKRTPINEDDQAISSYAGYFVGKVDIETKKFIPDGEIKLLDYGFDFYAPQSFKDNKGRRIIVGWMSRMDDEQEKVCPTREKGYIHCLTMPRELKWQNNKLYQIPLKEYKSLRKAKKIFTKSNDIIFNNSSNFELVIELNGNLRYFSLFLNNGDNFITYDNRKLKIGRTSWVNGQLETKIMKLNYLKKLHIFCDNSALEIFVNDGEYVFSLRYFYTKNSQNIIYKNLKKTDKVTFYSYEEENI